MSLRRANGTFLPGTHWRPHQQFRDRAWLEQEYLTNGRSAGDIARQFDVGDTAIHFWLKRHGIRTRSVSEARKMKHWGAEGPANPMYGCTGARNPRWRGGLTPLRQSMYASAEWKRTKANVRARDRSCLLCSSEGRWHYHHIIPFCMAPLLALAPSNVCRLCIRCHHKIKGREMRYAKRLQRLVAGKEELVR